MYVGDGNFMKTTSAYKTQSSDINQEASRNVRWNDLQPNPNQYALEALVKKIELWMRCNLLKSDH